MNDAQEPDPDPLVRYPLSWPESMAMQVAKAARALRVPMSVWVREAIREKLQKEGSQS